MKGSGLHEVIEALDALWPEVDIQMSIPEGMDLTPDTENEEAEVQEMSL